MTKVEMARTLQRIRKVQNDMDALKRELDELKDTVKAEMVATGEHKVEAGGCIATYQEVTSNRFNSSALKAEDKATYDKYVVASTTARLTVKWPELTHAYRYLLAIVFDDKDACQLEQADGLDYISEQADMVAGYWRKEDGFYGVAVIDNDTGEIMHMAD